MLSEFNLHSTCVVDLYILFFKSVFSSVTYLVGYKDQAEDQSPGLNLQSSTCHPSVQVLMSPAHRSTSSASGSLSQCQMGKHCHPEEASLGSALQQSQIERVPTALQPKEAKVRECEVLAVSAPGAVEVWRPEGGGCILRVEAENCEGRR